MFRFHCICSYHYSVAGIRLSVLARSIGCSIKEDVADRRSDDRAPLIHMMEDRRMGKPNLHLIQNMVRL